MNDLDRLIRLVRTVLARSVEADRRFAGTEFRGRVAEVDGARHAIKLVIGQTPEGDDVLSPWVPVSQTAGKLKFHDLPSVGQQGSLVSPGGDIEQARFVPLHWSSGNEAISDDPDVKVMEFGGVTVRWDDSSISLEVGATAISLTEEGVTINGAIVAVEGSRLTHNGVNVGDTHVHGGVDRGGSQTNPPS